MTLPMTFSQTETTASRPETAMRQSQQAQLQSLSRDCWTQMGAMSDQATRGETAQPHSLGLPDLSFFNSQEDSHGANAQDGRGDNQTTTQPEARLSESPTSDPQDNSRDSSGKPFRRAEHELRQDVKNLKNEKDPSKPEIEQLQKISGELQKAQRNHDSTSLRQIVSELQQLNGGDGSGGGGGGSGGSGDGNGTSGSGQGSGGTGGGGGGSGTGGSSGSGPGGTGSSETTFGTNAQPTVDQSAPGFYVSATGSANGNGSKSDPFATLQQAQQAMQNSDIKNTYVEGGTYNMNSSLNLTSADSGESFISVGGASNPAVLNGGGKLSDLISLNNANNVNIEGFSMEDTANSPVWSSKHAEVLPNVGAIYATNSSGDNLSYNSMNNVNVGVNMQGDSNMNVASNSITNAQSAIDSGASQNNVYGSNNTIQGNLVDNITGYGAKLFDNVGAINILGDTNATIDNNVVENTAGVGIEMNYRQNGSGFTVSNNTLENTDDIATTAKADTSSNPVGDDGAIHIIVAPGSTKNLDGNIDNNYVNGAGANRADKGIYLDDGVNGVTVDGNFVNEGGAGDAMQIHGGSDNTVENNTFDLGSGKGILYQTDGFAMTGNKIEANEFLANGSGTQAYQLSNTNSADMPTFSGNQYSPSIDQSPDSNGTTNTSLTGATTDSSPTSSKATPTDSADTSTDWSQMTSWLQSGMPGGIQMNGDLYQVPMTFDNGQQGTIVWDTSGNSTFNASGYTQYTDASGQVNQLTGENIPIGLSPILLS